MYFGSDEETDEEKVSLVYADTPFDIEKHFDEISEYTDALREAALEASDEESILIVVHEIYHSIGAL